jgi:nucleoside-diphosphate-sugar epimerase
MDAIRITGEQGFTGRHITRRLAAGGFSVEQAIETVMATSPAYLGLLTRIRTFPTNASKKKNVQ